MSFYGIEFTYNGIPSSKFGLFIARIDGDGVVQSTAGSSVKPITQKITRNPIEYLYGVEQGPVLEFDLEFFSVTPLSATDRSIVSSWLFGQQKRQKLQIMQGDLADCYFNCLISSAESSFIGNLSRGFRAHVVCDSPFAWRTYPETLEYTGSGTSQISLNFPVYNISADNYYTLPIVQFTMGSAGSTFTLNNITDEAITGVSRTFEFTNLTSSGPGGIPLGEQITVNNKVQTIVSSKALVRLPYFSLKWARLLPGYNLLQLYGSFTQFKITYEVAKKVGG